ncbi:Gp138 family membrane-puncturing spike protein [Fusobacterium pseudoperiodonticum]|uniref:Gp138 family membrane-puncturing spike protein n=1 Tax=Fusobacterium pseudoperiodonticum TaxID=2663009 RepID=UPI0028E1F8F6|nr:Gp138 family membrane-puncturing spike protein [Fusobacterium pseudoperiodonticum]
MIGLIKNMIDDSLNELHTSLACKITSINHSAGTCTVQPLAKRELCQQKIDYPPLIDVRLDFLKFGGWSFQIPRKVGDIVWVGFSETALSDETSLERFSLNEPYIIGSCESGYEANSDDIILQGAGTRIEIKGNGDITILAGSKQTTITSNVTLNGDLTINGDTTQKGSITATGDVIGKGISLNNHTHNYNPGPSPETSTSKAK